MANKNRFAAMARAFLGGCIGLHDFYLGRNFRGSIKILALVFFGLGFGLKAMKSPKTLLFLPSFMLFSNLASGLKLLSIRQEDFDFKYNPHLFTKVDKKAPKTDIAVADEILKLNELFEKGLITFEEFEKRKKKLLE
ncbi:MAG: NINE protein [Raineya sp.]|jgi:hypothetical protein|nr:NINE protein [Raineya sp.]